MANRDTIFIGHANPEDNEFTLWLYAKLINEGYSVVCDLIFLTGGEDDYWDKLQTSLDHDTCKYLLVFSKHTFSKAGVTDEWEHVRGISRRENIKDFVILLKVDDVPFDERIGTSKMNQFRFDLSWANGLKKLLYKLKLDGVPKTTNKLPLTINDWLMNMYTTFPGISDKKEKFYSNWLEIPNIPDEIYFHRYLTSKQVSAVQDELAPFPSIRHDTFLVTFVKNVPTSFERYEFEIAPTETTAVKTKKIFREYSSKNFPQYHDLRRLFVRLMKRAIQEHFKAYGLNPYELSGKKNCYYFEKDFLEKDKVHFTYEGKTTRKNLVGRYGESLWHHAISIHPLLTPQLCFSMKSHLLFSDDGKTIWNSKSKRHAARRRKGKSFFNKDWRSFILAFLSSISDEDGQIHLRLSPEFEIVLANQTIVFECNKGYNEPADHGRLVPIDYNEELEEWLEESEEFEETYD